jgi:hypothetical protein
MQRRDLGSGLASSQPNGWEELVQRFGISRCQVATEELVIRLQP